MNPQLWTIGLPLFCVFFAAVWTAACWGIARFGGWRDLAGQFRRREPIQGTTWRFQSAAVKRFFAANYGNCLKITAGKTGLGLAVFPLFRAGHPPLLIPWSEITIADEQWLWGLKRSRLTLRGMPSVTIIISPKLARRIENAVREITQTL